MITCTLTGLDTATAGNISYKGARSPIGNLARKLLDDGVDPSEIMEIKRGDTVCFNLLAVGSWAKLSTSETDTHSVKHINWTPMPEGISRAAK